MQYGEEIFLKNKINFNVGVVWAPKLTILEDWIFFAILSFLGDDCSRSKRMIFSNFQQILAFQVYLLGMISSLPDLLAFLTSPEGLELEEVRIKSKLDKILNENKLIVITLYSLLDWAGGAAMPILVTETKTKNNYKWWIMPHKKMFTSLWSAIFDLLYSALINCLL